MTKGELKKLFLIIESAEQDMATLESGGGAVEEVLQKVRTALREFRSAAGKFGVKGLAQVGEKMERYAGMPALSAEHLTTLTFALGLLRKGMQEGSSESIRSSIIETLELLGFEPLDVSVPKGKSEPVSPRRKTESSWMLEQVESGPGDRAVATPKEEKKADASRIETIAGHLGGKIVPSDESPEGSLRLDIPIASLERIEFLLSPFDSGDPTAQKLSAQEPRLENVLKSVKEFMASFAGGNLDRAQEILEELSSMQGDGELFKEIGSLARELHDSLRSFAATLDPDLREFVEDKLPDSGDRLEHILQLTESAANTTLDHAETIQSRIRIDQQRLARLERHFAMLRPIGTAAGSRMEENAQILAELKSSLSENIEDLTTILTSQGYQDLAGQIIQKMLNYHKELQVKMVGLVQTFGVTVNKEKVKEKELYGPAHKKMAGALHSQDEIDSLLADFGF